MMDNIAKINIWQCQTLTKDKKTEWQKYKKTARQNNTKTKTEKTDPSSAAHTMKNSNWPCVHIMIDKENICTEYITIKNLISKKEI